MAITDTFSFRMNAELKKKFEAVCAELGMSAATAFNVFAITVVRERRIPFTISCASKEVDVEEDIDEEFAEGQETVDFTDLLKEIFEKEQIPLRTQKMILYKFGFVDGSSHTNLETGKWIEAYNEGKTMSAEGVRKSIQSAVASLAEHNELQSILNVPRKSAVNEIKLSDGSTVSICEIFVVFEDDTLERVAYSDSLSQEIAEIYAKQWTKEKTVKEVRLQDASGNVLDKYDF